MKTTRYRGFIVVPSSRQKPATSTGACTCGSGRHYLFLWDAITGKFNPHFPFGSINVRPDSNGHTDPPIEYKGEQQEDEVRLDKFVWADVVFWILISGF